MSAKKVRTPSPSKSDRLRKAATAAVARNHWLLSPWLWLAVVIVLFVLVFWARTAAAQTDRGTEIIARAMALKPDRTHGAMLYDELCASCHGRNARGSSAAVTPALAGQLQSYIVKQLADFAEGDRTAPEMHRIVALKKLSTPQAMRDLASYMNGLLPNPAPEHGDGKALALGERVFQASCAQCHGEQGEGDDRYAVPSLQYQHYSYLLMQMRRLAVGHRYSMDIEVIEALEALPLDQLTALADYVSRLPLRRPDITPASRPD